MIEENANSVSGNIVLTNRNDDLEILYKPTGPVTTYQFSRDKGKENGPEVRVLSSQIRLVPIGLGWK